MTATKWMRENWRPLAAFIYLAINVFDFLIAPIFMGLNTETTAQFVAGIAGLDPSVQAIMASKPNGGWTPLTLQGSGMFHISFGAILGVSAWSRGTEKVHELRAEAYDNAMTRSPGVDPYAQPAAPAPTTTNVSVSVDSPEGD